jgi:hypothetical protein
MKQCAVAALGVVMVAGACGGGVNAGGEPAAATATPPERVSVKITEPQDGAPVNPRVVVRGLASPESSSVDVNGEAARVRSGHFTAIVLLDKGDAQVQATAAANGSTDQSSVTVKRLPSAAEKRAAAKRKAVRARRRQAAKSKTPTTSGSDGSFAMPAEVGMSLQDAQDDVQRVSGDPVFVSHSHDATGADRFQILDRDWKVCGQNVPPGKRVSAVGHIVFSVVKDDESCP